MSSTQQRCLRRVQWSRIMRHNEVVLTDEYMTLISYENFGSSSSNSYDIAKMKNILQKAMVAELTEKQLFYISEYYLKGKRMKEIAAENNVHPSTVTRHIKRAVEKLRRVAQYY